MAIKRFPINLEQIGIDPSAIIKPPVYSVPEIPAPAPVKPPRGDAIKVPIKQPPLPLPGESGPIIANPGVPPIPMPPVEPQIPMPAPVPQVPAPAPVPQPAPVPIPEPPMPAPVPQVPAPVPAPEPVPIPEPVMPPPPPVRVDPPLPPAPPVNELPPPIQVPPPINLPAPPDDIVSRGTVGPVAPPPVEVPPPVMQPAPEPVAPPIPLAPSQPGVPTPMAPGSFQGVLPGPEPTPEPVAPPPVEVPPPVMQPAPEPVAPPVELPPMMEVDREPGVLPTFGRVDDPRLAQVQPPMDEPTGIETMAPAVGFGDYLGGEVEEAMPTQPAPQPAQENTISLPDGSSFDLSTLDLTGLPGEGFDFEMPTMPGPTPPAPTPEPTPEPEPTLPPGTGLTLDELVSLGQDVGGFVEPGMGTYTPGIVAGPESTASVNNRDETQGTSPSDFMGGFNPEDYVTPAGEFLTDGQLAEYGDLEPGTPIPTNTTNTSLTPEQQAALDEYLASNPGGINVDLLGFNPFGQNAGMGAFGSIPSGTVPDGQGGYSVIPVGPVGDLDNTGGQAPGRVDVRSASSYGLTGAQQTMPVSNNPFRRPETQGGIGSLAGGG